MGYLNRLSLLSLALALQIGTITEDQNLPKSNATYGTISELKDKHQAYIATTSPSSKSFILTELKKYPGIKVVDRASDADFIISFVNRFEVARITGAFMSQTHEVPARVGYMKVYMVKEARHLRIVWEKKVIKEMARDQQNEVAADKVPAELDTIRAFIAALKHLSKRK